MSNLKRIILLTCLLFTISSAAQDQTIRETITLQTADDVGLVADFYPASADLAEAPVVIMLHMLNSNRAAYEPLIPDLNAAGYSLLNIDMRGHGDSGGAQIWDATIADMQSWVGWLEEGRHLGEAGLAGPGREHRLQCRADQLRRDGSLPGRHRALARAGLPRRTTGGRAGRRLG